METVFTISGAEFEPAVNLLDSFPGATPSDIACAQPVKPAVVAAGLSAIGGLGAGVFSIYKFGQRHNGAAVASAVTAAGLWWIGTRLMRSALIGFQACRGKPLP